ncbi:Magnesium/proton exchanger, partial [Ananas comosus]
MKCELERSAVVFSLLSSSSSPFAPTKIRTGSHHTIQTAISLLPSRMHVGPRPPLSAFSSLRRPTILRRLLRRSRRRRRRRPRSGGPKNSRNSETAILARDSSSFVICKKTGRFESNSLIPGDGAVTDYWIRVPTKLYSQNLHSTKKSQYFDHNGLGPGTLVGSAAFDLFPIHAVCVVVPKA